jgi:hypothetical protein
MVKTTRLLAGIGIAGAVMFAGACGGNSGGGASSTTSAAAPAGKSAGAPDGPMAAYRQCMEQHGVTMPQRGAGGQRPSGAPGGRPSGTPGVRPSGFPGGMQSMSPQQQAAAKACASVAPQRGQGGSGGGQNGG